MTGHGILHFKSQGSGEVRQDIFSFTLDPETLTAAAAAAATSTHCHCNLQHSMNRLLFPLFRACKHEVNDA